MTTDLGRLPRLPRLPSPRRRPTENLNAGLRRQLALGAKIRRQKEAQRIAEQAIQESLLNAAPPPPAGLPTGPPPLPPGLASPQRPVQFDLGLERFRNPLEAIRNLSGVFQQRIIEPSAALGTEFVQRLIPGEQEIERKAAEFRAGGLGNLEATRQAYLTSDLPRGVKGAIELAADPTNLLLGAGFGTKAVSVPLRAAGLLPKLAPKAVAPIAKAAPAFRVAVPTFQEFAAAQPKLAGKPLESQLAYREFVMAKVRDNAEVAKSLVMAEKPPFHIQADGMIRVADKPLDWNDVFTKYDVDPFLKANLNPAQKAYILNYRRNIVEPITELLDRYGIKHGEIGLEKGGWVPRIVMEKGEIKARQGIGRFLGTKAGMVKSRLIDDVTQARLANPELRYVPDPVIVASIRMEEAGRMVADREFTKWLRQFGELPSKRVPSVVRHEAAVAADRSRAAQIAVNLANRGMRGEEIPTASIEAVKRRFPGVGGLGETLEIAKTRFPEAEATTRAAFERAREAAKDALIQSREAYHVAKGQVRREAERVGPHLGEAVFQGRIYGDAAAKALKKASGVEAVREISQRLETRADGFLAKTASISGALVAIQAGADFAAPVLQGLPWAFSIRHSAQWAKATLNHYVAWFSKNSYHRYIRDNLDVVQEILALPNGKGLFTSPEWYDALARGGILTAAVRQAEKVPVLGFATKFAAEQVYGRAQRAMTAYLTSQVVESYKAMRAPWLRNGGILDGLLDHVRNLTGIRELPYGMSPGRRNFERTLFFANRYMRSYLAVLYDATRGGLRGGEAREALGRLLAGGLGTYTMASLALGQKPNLDLRSGRALTVEIGGSHIGPGSIYFAGMRSFFEIIESGQESYKALREGGLSELREESDFLTLRPSENPFLRVYWGRASPVMSTFTAIVQGETYMGEPLNDPKEFAKYIGTRFLPFSAEGYLSDVPKQNAATLPFQVGGFRTFPLSFGEQLANLEDRRAIETFGTAWDSLDGLEKEQLRQKFPDLVELRQVRDEFSIERGRDPFKSVAIYTAKTEEAHKNYTAELQRLEQALRDGRIGPRDFRALVSDAGGRLRDFYDSFKNPSNPDHQVFLRAEKWFSEQRAEFELRTEKFMRGLTPAEYRDLAYYDYIRKVLAASDMEDDLGRMDWDKRDQRVKEWEAEWPEYVNYVRQRIYYGRQVDGEPELVAELRDGRVMWRLYWELHKTLLGFDSERIKAFEAYEKAPAVQRQELARANPWLKTMDTQIGDARERMRRINEDLDAFLFKFGFVSRLLHKENTKREREIAPWRFVAAGG